MHSGGGMKNNDWRLVVNEKNREKWWKDYMEKIMNGIRSRYGRRINS